MRATALTPLLNVADVAVSLAWYRHLGFQELVRFEHDGRLTWAKAGSGALRLMLNRSDRVSAADRRARPGSGDAVLYLTVDDAPAAHAELVAAGLAPGPVERQSHGGDAFLLRDPDGHEIAVTGELTRLA